VSTKYFALFALFISTSSIPGQKALPIEEVALESSLHERLAAREAKLLELPPSQRVNSLIAIYAAAVDSNIFQGSCLRIGITNLEDLFASTALIAFYQRSVEWVDRLKCLHIALEAKGRASHRHHQTLHGLLVAVRRFDEANQLRSMLEGAPPALPLLAPRTGYRLDVIRLMDPGGAEYVDLDPPSNAGFQVIALVDPRCSFSRRALDSIVNDPQYDWLRPHLQLVVPRDVSWPETAMRTWNAAHPSLPMYAEAMGEQWISLDALETPVFHLMKNDNLLDTAIGWKGDGEDLRSLREILAQDRGSSAKPPK
jgi:hypothetical protein